VTDKRKFDNEKLQILINHIYLSIKYDANFNSTSKSR